LTSIHVNSTLEPNGLSRDDGKCPDGIKGQPLVWDVTVVDTLADSYVLKTSEVCKRKHSKYSSIISSNYVQWNSVITNTQGTSECVRYIRSFVLTVRRRYLLRKINNYIGIHKIIW
jgi:hypothetical protein